jgi:UDP-glucose 4-epimerase
MRVLITGGAGFVGSHLAEVMLARGDEVTVLDDLSTGRFANLDGIQRSPGFRFVWGDIRDERLLEDLVRSHEAIFHLAAAVGVRLVVERPVLTIESNVRGTENLLRFAARYWRRTLIASTSEVYGKSERAAFREDDDCILGATSKRRWAYAASKCVDEFLALAYHEEMRLPVVVARMFNTVGPRQTGRYGMVLPRFVRQALSGEPITVYGDGRQTRCFAHVSDVTRALSGLLECTGAEGEVVNVGATEEVSILDLARMVKVRTGSASGIVKVPFDEAYAAGFEDIRHRKPDLRKARRLIGYRPKVDLPGIIDSVVAWFRGGAGAS